MCDSGMDENARVLSVKNCKDIELLELARLAIISLNNRKNEDIQEWAKKLAEDVCNEKNRL